MPEVEQIEENLSYLFDSNDLPALLHQIERWRKVKSRASTVVLWIRPDNSRFRLELEERPPANRVAGGWRKFDLGEFFPEMKAK